MIVATAGHVDHGKTALVRALTGIETDTLDEEIQRGLSINLGYAYLPATQTANAQHEAIGFIDVPGHRRFINTMISGISGIDMGLLVVAADDGPMPQTAEHIDVLDILGVTRLVVVISKIDRVEPGRVAQVREQLDELIANRRWPEHATFTVSSLSGLGLDALQGYLLSNASSRRRQAGAEGFRLSIDRSFNVNGVGLVVTGTASAGTVRKGDRLQLVPEGKEVRIRHLRANNQDVETAEAGQRVALGLSGKVSLTDMTRGHWLVAPGGLAPTTRLDVRIRLLANAPFSLKHMAPVKCYLGANRCAARLAIIAATASRVEPGGTCLAQLLLESPVSAVWGERFLIRDHAETLILGGGSVLDPQGPKFGKSRPNRVQWLHALEIPDADLAMATLLQGERALNMSRFWRIRNFSVIPDTAALPEDVRVFEREGNRWGVRQSVWSSVASWLQQHIEQWHRDHPQLPGRKRADLQVELDATFDPNLGMAVLESQLRQGHFTLRDGHVSRKGFQPAKSQQALDQWQQLKTCLEKSGPTPPLLSDLLKQTGIPEGAALEALRIGMGQGQLHRLNGNRYALPQQLAAYYQCLTEADTADEAITVGNMKKRFDSGRNLTVEVLEYFDALRLTRREGNVRKLLDRANVAQLLGAGG